MSTPRWGVGPAILLVAVLALSPGNESRAQPAAQNDQVKTMAAKAAAFLKTTQNEDGSWGKEPQNRGVHTHHAVIVLFRPETGEPTAVLDGRLITEMRTAAASAVATDALARPDPKVLGILGAGVRVIQSPSARALRPWTARVLPKRMVSRPSRRNPLEELPSRPRRGSSRSALPASPSLRHRPSSCRRNPPEPRPPRWSCRSSWRARRGPRRPLCRRGWHHRQW